MLENFYFLFTPSDTQWEPWIRSGFQLSFIVLLAVNIVFAFVYYVVLGRTNDTFATLGKWLLFLTVDSLIVFGLTLFILGYQVFETTAGFSGFPTDVWIFSLINAVPYSVLIFLISSLLLNKLSLHARYIPFQLFKK